jgi:hypothetical protein
MCQTSCYTNFYALIIAKIKKRIVWECIQGLKGEKGDTGHGGFNGAAPIDHSGFPGGFMDGPPGPPGPPGKQVG